MYRLVIDVLKGVEGERKCFRLVGGVLVERSVKEVLPALEHNNEQVGVRHFLVYLLHHNLPLSPFSPSHLLFLLPSLTPFLSLSPSLSPSFPHSLPPSLTPSLTPSLPSSLLNRLQYW